MENLQIGTFVQRAERRSVNLRGFAISSTRDSDVLVGDLSYEGCQLVSDEAFEPGETFELRIIKRGVAQAEVRWAADGRAGARFVN